jgi:hypothetical protein
VVPSHRPALQSNPPLLPARRDGGMIIRINAIYE